MPDQRTSSAWLAGRPGDPVPGAQRGGKTLVLHDPGTNGDLYGMQAANLVSHQSAFELRTVEEYQQGDPARFSAIVYIGHDAGAQLPETFVADVRSTDRPVAWFGYGVERLFADPGYSTSAGWRPEGRDEQRIIGVDYKGARLDRDTRVAPPVRVHVVDGTKIEVLAQAVHDDGSLTPWAVRSGPLTYVAEVPFSYVGQTDRYLAAADLILPKPALPQPPRALVRLEDVGPTADPGQLRVVADYLHSRGVPFAIAVYPRYRDPKGVANNGAPTDIRLADRPAVAEALRYLIARGGTVVLHGYTHQYGEEPNPYNGVSGADLEFYRGRLDRDSTTELLGPVPGDSTAWARERFTLALDELAKAGVPEPQAWEFPHYTASAADYQAATDVFGVRYDRGNYFAGWCRSGCGLATSADLAEMTTQTFPFVVRDVYGAVVIPENLGYLPSWTDAAGLDRSISAVVSAARALRVVDDGVASFFYHPGLGIDALGRAIDGVQAAGYRFVSLSTVRPG